jgi:FkbM family methyltransferase
MRILNRLWNLTPREFVAAIRRRAWPTPQIRPSWHTVRGGPLAGTQMLLAPAVLDAWREMAEGTYDDFIFQAVRSRVDLAGRVCWDLGAHFGYHSMGLAVLVGPAGKVLAFEPNPANGERIRLNLERNPELAARIELMPCAVGNQVGTMRFVASSDLEGAFSSGSHIVGADTPHQYYGVYGQFRETDVAVTTIDQLIFQQKVAAPAFMKIDVEGAETMVLEGGAMFFQQHRPALAMEIHHILQMQSVQQMLIGLGYRIEVLDREHAEPGRCFIFAHHPEGGTP